MSSLESGLPEPQSHDDDASSFQGESATRDPVQLTNSLNHQDDVKQNAPVIFTSTTIAPSPPPAVCDRSSAPTTPSPLDTARQKYCESSSTAHSSPIRTSGLRLQTDVATSHTRSPASDTSEGRLPSKPISIARTPSIKQVLASSIGSNTHSVSAPNSALSSPLLSAMPDLTPLPSPIISNDSPGPWRRHTSRPTSTEFKKTPLTGDTALVTPSGELILSAIANQSKRRAYHGLLNFDDATSKVADDHKEKKDGGRERNRSLSEYTPGPISLSKPRQQAVSASHAAAAGDSIPEPIPYADSRMQREPHLALQRGIAPIPRPPTPPSSRTGGESSDSDSSISYAARSFVRAFKKPRTMYFDATTIADNKRRRWRALKPLGEGTFSKVVLATSQLDKNDNRIDEDDVFRRDDGVTSTTSREMDPKKLVAIKICEHGPKGGASEERVEISLKRELEIMKSIHHPSLVDLRAWNIEETRAILVLGYCPGGDLFEVASQRPSVLVPSLLQRIFAEIVFAIQYLHERHIVHRDIKLENVLVNLPRAELAKSTDWATYPYSVITVTDLGLARRVTDDEKPLTTRCGSDDYAAPEVIMGQPYDGCAVDAWSLGVLLYALLESRLPFDPNPGMAEGHKQRSRTSHRIARVEWRWYLWEGEDGDHEGSIAKFEAAGLGGAMEVTENLLKRARSRWTVERVTQVPWVRDAIRVEGGLKFREEERAEEVLTAESLS